MNKEQLIQRLKDLQEFGDIEVAHSMADKALIAYINDPEVTKLFEEMEKWYA